MTATNHTTNYELSQFEENDRPTWLGDYNSDIMSPSHSPARFPREVSPRCRMTARLTATARAVAR